MAFSALKKKAHSLLDQASYISQITSDNEHQLALKLMEELIEDYEYNRLLIEILSVSIAKWEDEADSFQDFNQALTDLEPGSTMLKMLMDHHHLGVADFPELGSASLVSKIVNNKRRLTLDHIYALSKRFDIDPALFL